MLTQFVNNLFNLLEVTALETTDASSTYGRYLIITSRSHQYHLISTMVFLVKTWNLKYQVKITSSLFSQYPSIKVLLPIGLTMASKTSTYSVYSLPNYQTIQLNPGTPQDNPKSKHSQQPQMPQQSYPHPPKPIIISLQPTPHTPLTEENLAVRIFAFPSSDKTWGLVNYPARHWQLMNPRCPTMRFFNR